MYGKIALGLAIVLLVLRFTVYPVVVYFVDRKGFRRYPNMSLFSGVSNIPFMIEARRGFRSKHLAELHQKHPVIRIGPNSLSYGDVRAIKMSTQDIYGHSTKCTKDDFYDLLSGSHYHLADVIDKGEHQRKRKVLSSAYAIKNLEGWEYKVADKVGRLVKKFDQHSAPPQEGPIDSSCTVDWRAWSNFFTMDAIADIGLSASLGFLDQGDDMTTSETLDGTTSRVSYRDCLHSQLTALSQLVWAYKWHKSLCKWFRRLSLKQGKLLDKGDGFDGIVLHQARQRLQRYQKGEKLDDFFQALMESKDGAPNHLPFGEIVAEISIMMNAGSVSTAVAINNAMLLLARHQPILSKLREEIDAVADSDEIAISYDKIKDLPYLRACLDESMRVLPPTPFGLPRKTPPEGCQVFGQWVPGNTTVSMSAYVAHRDESVFPDPEVFRPERWLGEEGKQLQPYFITFSAGARGCIGRNISYLEQTILLASVIHRYDVELESPDFEQSWYEHFNMVPGPLPLRIRRRQHEA
ncbi:cytochrome P450 [Aspergillus insuetus]